MGGVSTGLIQATRLEQANLEKPLAKLRALGIELMVTTVDFLILVILKVAM
jgi:hypothetical protein